MNHTSAEPELALCAAEKIHLPGSIQPHGVLLCLNERDLTVVQVSESSLSVFGRPRVDLIGASLQSLVGFEPKNAVEQHFSGVHEVPASLPLKVDVTIADSTQEFDVVIHRSDGCLIMEFERAVALEPAEVLKFLQAKNDAINKVFACETVSELLEFVAAYVREITGFDRVMIYLFDRDWNGTVKAESRIDSAVSYLGLCFPAGDIPPQARNLYVRNCLRLLVDVDAVPSPILPALNPQTGEPLDLSSSVLRSMSPVHIEYLKNMRVRASMSVSLVSNGELRGLIACHHSSERHVSRSIRDTCEFLARLVSMQMDTLEERENYKHLMNLQDARRALILHASGEEDFVSGIAGSDKLLDVALATGAAIVWDDRIYVVGAAPDIQSVSEIAQELTGTVKGPVFASDSLSKCMPRTKALTSCASGLLAVRISATGPRWLLWFRPEQVAEVKWAGNPEKILDVDDEKRLHPRKSFEVWKKNLTGQSRPWLSAEIETALELRAGLLDLALAVTESERAKALKHRVDELNKLNGELEVLSEQLRAACALAQDASRRKSEMVSVVSHDLRAPLTSIKGSLDLLSSGMFEIESAAGELIGLAGNSTAYLLNLIEALLNLDSLESGVITLNKSDLCLRDLVTEAFDFVRSAAAKAEIDLEMESQLQGDCRVFADKERVLQVLVNLISNALKFSLAGSRIVVSASSVDSATVVKVADQGRGIPTQFLEVIFQRFQQVESTDRTEKRGVGLGLAICKSIVEAHGGTIGVESEPGKGSTFWFTVPKSSPS